MNERQWIQATLQGDKEAFTNIVEKHQGAVFNLAYRLLLNAVEAEDAAQESFVRAYTHLSTYDPAQSFITWLLSITAHYCIDVLRRSRRAVTVELDESRQLCDGEADPERYAVARERDRAIRQALDLLSPHYRPIVVLRYWYDMSCKEIGKIVGLSEGAVKVRLHRAREMLAQSVRQQGDTAESRPDEGFNGLKETEGNALFKS